MGRRRRKRGPVGIALAGGGPLGGIYEIGALVALQEALNGVEFTDLDVYVGVSSGAFLAAGLANGLSPREMHAMFILDDSHHDPFEPELLLRPAFKEFARRLKQAPSLLKSAGLSYLGRGRGSGFIESFLRLTRGLPTGLFDNEPIALYLRKLFNRTGRSDDFRKLRHKLFILAADLDSGKATPFGAPGLDHVPISEAVKASSALPGLYPPAHIGGRDYVDGAVKKTLHASVALKEGVRLLICVNPIVPYNSDLAGAHKGAAGVRLAEGGLLSVLSQSFRALIHSRMRIGMDSYAHEFPDADVILFEPAQDDAVMFFTNIFSYAGRRELAEHAYRHTRDQLRRRADELAPILAKHGASLNRAVLDDAGRCLPKCGEFAPKGLLWDSLNPLGGALNDLERAFGATQGKGRAEGRALNGAEEATADA